MKDAGEGTAIKRRIKENSFSTWIIKLLREREKRSHQFPNKIENLKQCIYVINQDLFL